MLARTYACCPPVQQQARAVRPCSPLGAILRPAIHPCVVSALQPAATLCKVVWVRRALQLLLVAVPAGAGGRVRRRRCVRAHGQVDLHVEGRAAAAQRERHEGAGWEREAFRAPLRAGDLEGY